MEGKRKTKEVKEKFVHAVLLLSSILFFLGIYTAKNYIKYNSPPISSLTSSGDNHISTFTSLIDPESRKYFEQFEVDVKEQQQKAKENLTELEQRRERYRLRQAARKIYEDHLKTQSALIHCGKSCANRHKQLKIAFQHINKRFDRNLYEVLGVSNKDKLDFRTLKKRYNEIKAKVREQDEDRSMILEELHDALNILSDSDSRIFYNLYGTRPPANMLQTSGRTGGWGHKWTNIRSAHINAASESLTKD